MLPPHGVWVNEAITETDYHQQDRNTPNVFYLLSNILIWILVLAYVETSKQYFEYYKCRNIHTLEIKVSYNKLKVFFIFLWLCLGYSL